MININKILTIINYPYKENIHVTNYKLELKTILDNIKMLNWITEQLKLEIEQRDFVIKFKKFTSNEMFDSINPIFEKDNIGKWYNYIYTLPSIKNINIKDILFFFFPFLFILN